MPLVHWTCCCDSCRARRRRANTARLPLAGGDIEDFAAFEAQALRTKPAGVNDETACARCSAIMARAMRKSCAGRIARRIGACIPDTTTLFAEIRHAIEHEMAMKLEDVVMRRTELAAGSHPGRRALEAAAMEMAKHLRWSDSRMREELSATERTLARHLARVAFDAGVRARRRTDRAWRDACKLTRVTLTQMTMNNRQTQPSMRLLITGATGFIGSRLALHARRNGIDVLGDRARRDRRRARASRRAARRGCAGGNRHVARCRLRATSGARPHCRDSFGGGPARVAHAGRVFPLGQRRRRAAVAGGMPHRRDPALRLRQHDGRVRRRQASSSSTSRATCARKIPTR